MEAASGRHNDQDHVRRRGATRSERARLSQRLRDMEKGTGTQCNTSKERFKVHLSFVMPCRAPKLSNQEGDRQGISFLRRNSCSTNSLSRCT